MQLSRILQNCWKNTNTPQQSERGTPYQYLKMFKSFRVVVRHLKLTCDLTHNLTFKLFGWIIDMGRPISKKTVERKNEFDSRQHKSNLRNICGTFAAEGMAISKYTRRNLDRIASGQTSYQQVLAELREKYEKRG